jgi:very-short-patch-repair endonuclease
MPRPKNTVRRQERQQKFLAAYAQTGIVKLAATRSHIPASQHYTWISQDEDYAKAAAEIAEATKELAAQLRGKPGPQPGSQAPHRREALKRERQEKFLAAISRGLTRHEAAKEAGVTYEGQQYWEQTDPEYAARFQQAYEESAETRKVLTSEKKRKASKARWDDPQAREAWGEFQKTTWTPEKRAELSARMSRQMSDPEARKRLGEASRARWDEPGRREEWSDHMRALWADPGRRARFLAHYDEPGFRESVAETVRQHWASIPEEERNEKLRKMRRRMKGGNIITDIEATVMDALGAMMVPYIMHAPVDRYTADIFLPHLKLIIECDGAWHHDQRPDFDAARDEKIAELGFKTLRLAEAEIKDGSFIAKLREALEVTTE